MNFVQRKITYRLYPSRTQAALLHDTLALHCRAYNALLEEHQRRYESKTPGFNFSAMCKELTGWRSYSDALKTLNAQSLQVTAKRVTLAFDAFFRRLAAGDEPGYPRFKSLKRFAGWGFKTYGDGWKLRPKLTGKHFIYDRLYLTGLGDIPLRGQGRFIGTPKTCEILHQKGTWSLSVTFTVPEHQVMRASGDQAVAFDWGVTTLLTLAKADGSLQEIENPRWLSNQLAALKALQRTVSVEEVKAKVRIGLAPDAVLVKGQRLPVNARLKRLYAQVRAIHSKVARQRKDFYHKLTAWLVATFAFIGTEELAATKMTKRPKAKEDPEKPGEFLPNGAQKKAGLNRGILDSAPSMLLGMLGYKAEEAGNALALANTRVIKPTQRCHVCGALVPKELGERVHRCACGCTCGRDENAARTLLRWLLEGSSWFASGTDARVGFRPPLETPSIAALAV